MSTDLERVEFKVLLSGEWFRLPPHVKVYIDDQLIEDLEVVERSALGEQRTLEFDAELSDGEHELRIQYLDKEQPDTRVDENGNIDADHIVNIDSIEIDEIELGFMCYNKSVFRPDQELRPDLPAEMHELINIGYNGVWVMKFQVPTYIWFLENL